MKIKKYALVGAIIGGGVGLLSTLHYFICSTSGKLLFCETVSAIPNLLWMVLRNNSTLKSVLYINDIFEFITILLTYIFIGIILGLLYGLFKGQNNKFEKPL